MKILIDLVIFQLQAAAPRGITRIWHSLLPELIIAMPEAEFIFLHRGDPANSFYQLHAPGIHAQRMIPFASQMEPVALGNVCNEHGVDAFLSTYYSYQYQVPSVQLVYDLIPEELSWDLLSPEWQTKADAFGHARSFVCISQTTAGKLGTFYDVAQRSVRVGYCGVDQTLFRKASQDEVDRVKRQLEISDYFLAVGSRRHYKNFDMLARVWDPAENAPVICVGGEPLTSDEASAGFIHVGWQPDSPELRAYYSGATALLWPSLTEGFGLPLVEAMACGCPILASDIPINKEICGDHAQYLNPNIPERWSEMHFYPLDQFLTYLDPRFTWKALAEQVAASLQEVVQ